MRKINGFSLMEMMIVLLIVSIVAAASAPMINKKIVGIASEKSPWVWTGTSQNIAYNPDAELRSASVGITNPPVIAEKARFYIDTKKSGNYIPHLAFGTDQTANNVMKLIASKNNVWFSTEGTTLANVQNSVVIGSQAKAANHANVVVGSNAFAGDVGSVALGGNTKVSGKSEQSIALGYGAESHGVYSVSVGSNARVESSSNSSTVGAIAMGYNAKATHSESIAIGGKSSNNKNTLAANTSAIAIGASAVAGGKVSIALGRGANTTYGDEAVAIGYNTVASGDSAIAIGSISGTSLNDATPTRATARSAIAIGDGASSSKLEAIAIGKITNAAGNYSVALGREASSSGSNSMALGYKASASGTNAIAIGPNTSAATDEIKLGNSYHTVYVPGTLKPANLDLSSINGTITLGSSNATVYIPGRIIVDKDSVFSRLSGLTYVRMSQFNGNRNRLYRFYRGDGSGNRQDVMIHNDGTNPSLFSPSDRRLKNVGKSFVGGLKELKKLPLYHFSYKSDELKTPRVGIMAQDLQKVFPDAVSIGVDGFLQIRHEDLFYALVNAVKELDTMFTEHDKQMKQLSKENLKLKTRVLELEKRLAELEKNLNK